MMKNDFAFASSAVRVMENTLLPESFFDAIAAAEDRGELRRILVDRGLDAFQRPLSQEEAEEILAERLQAQLEEVASLTEEKSVLDFLFVKNDFHNLKASLLCRVLKRDPAPLFLSPSVCDPKEVDRLVSEKNWEEVPALLRTAAKEGYELLTSGMDSSLLRFYLDARALEKTLEAAKKTGSAAAVELTREEIDAANAKVARAMARFASPRQVLLDAAFAEGGSVSAFEWKKAAAGKRADEIPLYGADDVRTPAEREAAERKKAREAWEKAGREILTPDTLFAYCRAREREAEEIRAAWAATEGTKEDPNG